MEENKLPKLKDVYELTSETIKQDQFKQIVNSIPKKGWVKTNSYANDSKYIPIGVIETLLDIMFQEHRVEILREGVSFNGVYVVVRVHLQSRINNEWTFHDGIGAVQLQTKKGSSPAELQNINNNALMMAYPMAKSYAIKDACEHIGKLFGRDMNRKDVLEFVGQTAGTSIDSVNEEKERARVLQGIKDCKTISELESFRDFAVKYGLEGFLKSKGSKLTE